MKMTVLLCKKNSAMNFTVQFINIHTEVGPMYYTRYLLLTKCVWISSLIYYLGHRRLPAFMSGILNGVECIFNKHRVWGLSGLISERAEQLINTN